MMDRESIRSSVSLTGTQVSVRNLVKRYRTKRGDVLALDDVSIDIGQSERVVLLGPSGCGKTTLLRCVAGLEQPDEGEIEINGVTVFSSERGIFVPPEARDVSMMFQSYALWPHMTVAENVGYPLESRFASEKRSNREKVGEALRMVACDGFHNRYPSQLSGGQQQRVALARAIIANNGLVLFDEPLSNVDAKVREQLRIELVTLQRKLGFAWLYVTHDQTEATAVADRIAVFRSGQIAQLGVPGEIYNNPISRYVAEFMGAGNAVKGIYEGHDGGLAVVRSPIGVLRLHANILADPGTRVIVMFRPEHLEILSEQSDARANCFTAEVEASMFLGASFEHAVRAGAHRLLSRSLDDGMLNREKSVVVSIKPEHLRMFIDSEPD